MDGNWSTFRMYIFGKWKFSKEFSMVYQIIGWNNKK